MSSVSSVILQVSCAEDGFDCEEEKHKNIDKINKWLKKNNKFPLVDLTSYMQRGKHPQTFVFGAGYNFFPEEDFASFIINRKYNYPENVVLLINPEDGKTKVYRPLTK